MKFYFVPYPSAEKSRNAKNSNINNKGRNENSNTRDGPKNKSAADKILDEWSSANDAPGDDVNRIERDVQDMEGDMDVVPASSSAGAWQVSAVGGSDGMGVEVTDYYDMLQLMEEMLAGRNANRTSVVVTALVQYIVR